MGQVISQDGTAIAFTRIGSGPALIIVDGALCYRAFGPSAAVAEALSEHFTVYTYDRRGRGESGGGTAPHAIGREVEDIAALIAMHHVFTDDHRDDRTWSTWMGDLA